MVTGNCRFRAQHTHFRQEHVSTCIYYKVHVECDLRRLCLLDVVVTCVVVMKVLSTPLRGSLQEYTPFFKVSVLNMKLITQISPCWRSLSTQKKKKSNCSSFSTDSITFVWFSGVERLFLYEFLRFMIPAASDLG